MKKHTISTEFLSVEKVGKLIKGKAKIELSKESEEAVLRCRKFLDDKMKESKVPVYGITTGFGSLCNQSISPKDLSQLQYNLVVSHACGLGDRGAARDCETDAASESTIALLWQFRRAVGNHSTTNRFL